MKAAKQANDRDTMRRLTIENGSNLQFLPEDMRSDRDLQLAAVKSNQHALEYVTDEFLDDRDFVESAVRSFGSSLEDASERLRQDKDLLRIAVQESRHSLTPSNMDKLRCHLANPEVRSWFTDWNYMDDTWMIHQKQPTPHSHSVYAIHVPSQRMFSVPSLAEFHQIYRGLCPPPKFSFPKTDVLLGTKHLTFSMDFDEEWLILYLSTTTARNGDHKIRELEINLGWQLTPFNNNDKGLTFLGYAKMYAYDDMWTDGNDHFYNTTDLLISVEPTRFVFSDISVIEGDESEILPVLKEDWGLKRSSRTSMVYPSPHIGQHIHAESMFQDRVKFFKDSIRTL